MINHKERDHALLSASGASRWMNCNPSARLEELFPETTSEYAEEGTHKPDGSAYLQQQTEKA